MDPYLADIVRRSLPIESETGAEVMGPEKGCGENEYSPQVDELGPEHAAELFDALRTVELPFPPQTVSEVEERLLKRDKVFGVFVGDRLASAVTYRSFLGLGIISMVLTRPEYRGRGFATSAISAAIHHYFQDPDAERMALFVKSDNTSAKHVYQKVGFRTHKKPVYMGLGVQVQIR